jgi:hypothetical protein
MAVLGSAGVLGAAAALAVTACFAGAAGAAGATTGPAKSTTAKSTTTLPTKHTGSHARASTVRSLSTIKTEAADAVSNRVRILNSAMARIDNEKDLGAGRAALRTYLSADAQRLRQQGHVVASDTTGAQAQQDFVDIFSGFRVYRLVLPSASLVVRADRVTQTGLPALKAAAAKVQAASDSRNRATIEPLLADLDHQIAAASTATQGLAATVLAYTPAQWNADNGVLDAASSSVSTAERAIRQGRSDVQHIRQDLHGVGPGGGANPLHLHR